MTDNPKAVEDILQQNATVLVPRRNVRNTSQSRGQQYQGRGHQQQQCQGRGNQQRPRYSNRVRALHEVMQSPSVQLAMSQTPDAPPPTDAGGDTASL